MKQLTYALCAVLAVLLMIAIISEPPDTQRATTLEVLVQPAAAQQLEAQRLAAQVQQARIAAELERAAQAERTRRTLIISAALTVAVLCVGATWAAVAMSRRSRGDTYYLLPGAPGFRAALDEIGGRYEYGTPVDSRGREIRYLEVESD